MKPLSKEKLIERLRIIAADETPRKEFFGAMCYSQMAPPQKTSKCDNCGSTITYHDWDTVESICSIVSEMTGLGYDVKVEKICRDCAKALMAELYPEEPGEFKWDEIVCDGNQARPQRISVWVRDINMLFYFRSSPEEEYHRAIANRETYYSALLTLMQNERVYLDGFGNGHYIEDEKAILEFMTGIRFDA